MGDKKFTDSNFVKAFQAMSDVAQYFPKGFEAVTYNDSQVLFATGKAAMFIDGSWSVGTYGESTFDWGVFAIPAPMGHDTAITFHPDMVITMNTKTEHSAEAKAFLAWLCTPEGAATASKYLPEGFFPMINVPIKIASIKILEIMRTFGILNTIWSLILIYVAMGIPIGVFILTEFIRQIPKELTQAALIDGTGRFKIFTLIIVPLIKPALSTVAIYNLVPFWNDLWFPLIFITDEKSKTLLLGVTRLFGQYQTDWLKVLAVLTLSAIPVLVLYLSMSRQFIEGVTAGAVKG